MNLTTKKSVSRDIEKLPSHAKEAAAGIIEDITNAATLNEIQNVIPMEGTDEPYYRVRFGSYRMLLYYEKEKNTVKILAITNRKDSYKKQNLPWRK